MNIKKIVVTAGVAGVMLSSGIPAFASHRTRTMLVENNGSVNNEVNAEANTGHNQINSSRRGQNVISTGFADASSMLSNTIMTGSDCDCFDQSGRRVRLTVRNNGNINNDVYVGANTGHNEINGRRGEITTLDAAAGSAISNTINTSVGSSL